MVAKVNFTIRDYSQETSTVGIFLGSIAQAVTMQTAVDGVTSGIIAQRTEISAIVEVSNASPSDPSSQRELGLRVYYHDDVTQQASSFTIASPDVDALTIIGDAVTLADLGPMAALEAALLTDGASPAGNAITVDRAQIVGRAN
jgi:hypothetical protein